MKKIIVLTVLLCLIIQIAFAEINFRGEMVGNIALRGLFNYEDENGDPKGGLRGDDGLFDRPWLYSYYAPYNVRIRLRADVNNDSNTFGGFFRLTLLPEAFAAAHDLRWIENNEAVIGNVWWQPIPQLKVTFGNFAASWRSNMSGRIFFGNEAVLNMAYYGRHNPDRYGAWTNRLVHAWGWEEEFAGVSFEVIDPFDISGLYIAATLPLNQNYRMFNLGETRKDAIFDLFNNPTEDHRKVPAEDILMQTGIRIMYSIRGVGDIVASWDGGTSTLSNVATYSDRVYGFDASYINAHFNLTAIRNLQASIGFEYPLPITQYYRGRDPEGGSTWRTPEQLLESRGEFKRQLPYGIDIRLSYSEGDFVIGSGFTAYFGGFLEAGWSRVKNDPGNNRSPDDIYGRIDDPFEFGISINPEYRGFSKINVGIVNEFKFVQYVNTRLLTHPFAMTGQHLDRGAWMAFNINPYISTKLFSGGSAWAGLQIRGQQYSGFKDDDGTNWKMLYMWSIPIGFAYNF